VLDLDDVTAAPRQGRLERALLVGLELAHCQPDSAISSILASGFSQSSRPGEASRRFSSNSLLILRSIA
jgi:hypothetical protein